MGTDLLAVLISDYRPLRRASIGAEDDAVFEEASYDGGTGAGGLGQRDALFR